jgi:monomeric isocitrate dehydrogenase
MLNRLPAMLPSLRELMAECGNAKPHELAKALDVDERTVYRWLATDRAPRAALLSIFWVTKWGMSLADAETFNLAQLHMGMTEALKLELNRARAEIAALQEQMGRIGRLGDFGSANDPAPGVSGLGPAVARPAPAPVLLTFEVFDTRLSGDVKSA